MLIYGITKVRNEGHILKETLDHYGMFCEKIFVFDDASVDDTVFIAENHPKVVEVIRNLFWDPYNRPMAEAKHRQAVLEAAQRAAGDNRDIWFIYFDADERIDASGLEGVDLSEVDGIRMKLFDFYITHEDLDQDHNNRRWIGPEYREILMAFRNLPGLKYEFYDQREIQLPKTARIITAGYVKHYGKAISIDQWEETCKYYSDFWPEPYRSKWAARKGKAVHEKSDFGADLILWEDKEMAGYPL